MSTTVRLPSELKERVARAAKRARISAHRFMMDAIAEKAARDECRGDVLDAATRRLAAIAASGKGVPWSEMRRYLERKVKGEKIPRPKPRTFARL